MRKYGGGISGKRRNAELAQGLMKVATTAETKCSTIRHGTSSQHLPLEEQLALNLNVV